MMQISHRLRRLAATLTLVLPGLALQPALAAQPTQAANLLPFVALAASTVEGTPTSVRGDMLLANDGNIYLASAFGGAGAGSIAKVTAAGELSVLHSFQGGDSGGAYAYSGLIQASDGNLYGTTFAGGEDNEGVVYRITLAGEFSILHTFGVEKRDPVYPYTGLVQAADGYLYGTTLRGGQNDKGTVYRIATDGSGFSVLHEFDGNDGENPEGRLALGDDGALYGTTLQGGEHTRGTVYRVTTSGDYTLLYSFPDLGPFNSAGIATNDTGANPRAGLTFADGAFYGTAYQGGPTGYGTVFRITSAGAYTMLHSFTGPVLGGAYPLAGVVRDASGNLYGTTERGGYANRGTAWRLDAAGNFMLLHGFTGSSIDGMTPYASLLPAHDTLYVATYTDQLSGYGAIAKLDTGTDGVLPVTLTVSTTEITLGSNVEIGWSAPAGSTCTRISSWTGDTTISGSESVTPAAAGIYTYGISCTDAASVVRNAYVGIRVSAPPLEPVDGGGGAGALSLPLLALLAALLSRKFIKETSSPCP